MILNQSINNGEVFDWGRTSDDYAKYRDIYPDLFYQRIVDLGLCIKGQHVLDLGTGTGVLPRNLYRYGASFVGADISENQIAQARRLSAQAGMEIEYIVAAAEDVSFPAGSFDVVTACQCFVYFDESIVVPKIHTMLKDGGHFCILFMAWLSFESDIAKQSEELVLNYNPAWTGVDIERSMLQIPECSIGLFTVENAEVFDVNVTFSRESWHGRMKACRGIGASSLSDEAIAAFEQEHIEYLQSQPEHFDIAHFVALLNLRKNESA